MRSSGPGSRPGCGHWACGYWTAEQTTCCSRAPETLGDALRQRGVVLRSCGNYPGLDASWYRTAVRTGPENDELLKTLAEVLA